MNRAGGLPHIQGREREGNIRGWRVPPATVAQRRQAVKQHPDSKSSPAVLALALDLPRGSIQPCAVEVSAPRTQPVQCPTEPGPKLKLRVHTSKVLQERGESKTWRFCFQQLPLSSRPCSCEQVTQGVTALDRGGHIVFWLRLKVVGNVSQQRGDVFELVRDVERGNKEQEKQPDDPMGITHAPSVSLDGFAPDACPAAPA